MATVSPAFEAAFSTIGTPRAFRSLGGINAWWRITVHGPQGETIAIREVTHLCDPSVPDRDRLEFADGRVVGRLGPTVFAERHGLPWPTLVDAATHELALFGLHLRLCWWLADRDAYAEIGSEVVGSGSDSLTRISLIPRLLRAEVGPETSPAVVDRYELLFPLAGGQPRELRHEFAASRQHRRVLLEDWRPVGEVSMPFRRTYVDPDGKPTTTLELLRVEPRQEVADRDFRLH